MDQFGVDEASVETAQIEAVANRHASWVRSLLAGALPPLAALLVQSFYSLPSVRWSLFYPAVFIASWLGGFRSGVGATLLSTALLWYYFMPARHTFIKSDPRLYLTALIFIVMGVVVSMLHRQRRRATREVAQALLAQLLKEEPTSLNSVCPSATPWLMAQPSSMPDTSPLNAA